MQFSKGKCRPLFLGRNDTSSTTVWWGLASWNQTCREEPGAPGRQADHNPACYHCSRESLHYQKGCLKIKVPGHSPLLTPGETDWGGCAQLCPLQNRWHEHTRATSAQGHKDNGPELALREEWLGLSSMEKMLGGILSIWINIYQEQLKMMKWSTLH